MGIPTDSPWNKQSKPAESSNKTDDLHEISTTQKDVKISSVKPSQETKIQKTSTNHDGNNFDSNGVHKRQGKIKTRKESIPPKEKFRFAKLSTKLSKEANKLTHTNFKDCHLPGSNYCSKNGVHIRGSWKNKGKLRTRFKSCHLQDSDNSNKNGVHIQLRGSWKNKRKLRTHFKGCHLPGSDHSSKSGVHKQGSLKNEGKSQTNAKLSKMKIPMPKRFLKSYSQELKIKKLIPQNCRYLTKNKQDRFSVLYSLLFPLNKRKNKKCMNNDTAYLSLHNILLAYPVYRIETSGMHNKDLRLKSLQFLNNYFYINGHQRVANIDNLADSGCFYCKSIKKVICYSCAVETPINGHNSPVPVHSQHCDHNNGRWGMDGAGIRGQMSEQAESNTPVCPGGEHNISGSRVASLQVCHNTPQTQFSESEITFAGTNQQEKPYVSLRGQHGQPHGNVRSQQERSNVDVEESALLIREKLQISLDEGTQRPKDEDMSRLHRRESEQTNIAIETHRLLEENGQLKKRITCKICGDRPIKINFQPCGHTVTCTECNTLLGICPICECEITDRIPITLA